jgi:hypothetical protein
VGIDAGRLTSIREGQWTPAILDEIPQDRERNTRTHSGRRRDRVFCVSVQGNIAEIPAQPKYERIYRVRQSSYDDDVPNDSFAAGAPLSQSIAHSPIPIENAKYFLWHSEGYCNSFSGEMLPAWSNLDVVTLEQRVRVLLVTKGKAV